MKYLIVNKLKYAALIAACLYGTPAQADDNPKTPSAREGTHSFRTNDATLQYEIRGNGEPLFMLHGGLTSREDLRLQIDYFSHRYRVVALDSREHGFSSNSPHPISYELMAQDVANLANHLGFKKISLFGQSDGGITALTFAYQYPARASKIVLLSTIFNHAVISDPSKAFLRGQKWTFPLNSSEFPGVYLKDYLKGGRTVTDYQGWFDKLAFMWTTAPNFTITDLAKIQTPTLVINGDREDGDLSHTLTLYHALPNAELFIVPGATHFLHTEKPVQLHRAVEQFLSGSNQ